MPIYEYRCNNCLNVKSELKSVDNRDILPSCDKCYSQTSMVRILSPAFFEVKGFNARNGYSKNKGE